MEPNAEYWIGVHRGLLKLAIFNVNSVNARLPVLLRWLAEAQPDVACLQELKAPHAGEVPAGCPP